MDEYIQDEKISLNFIKKENLTGSYQGMRYLLKKQEEQIVAAIWPEPFCFEVTPEEQKEFAEFDFSMEGKKQAVTWLNEQYEKNKESWLKAKRDAFYW